MLYKREIHIIYILGGLSEEKQRKPRWTRFYTIVQKKRYKSYSALNNNKIYMKHETSRRKEKWCLENGKSHNTASKNRRADAGARESRLER